jgi:hypothetical protein
MARSVIFGYEVNNFNDVRDHLDALWYEFNELVGTLNSLQECSDPPTTCGSESGLQRAIKRAKEQRKRGAKTTQPTRQTKE